MNLNFIFDVATSPNFYWTPKNWRKAITHSGTSFREHATRELTQFLTMWLTKIVKICVGSTESYGPRFLASWSLPELITTSSKSWEGRVREEFVWFLLSLWVFTSLDYDILAIWSSSYYLWARNLLWRITSSETSLRGRNTRVSLWLLIIVLSMSLRRISQNVTTCNTCVSGMSEPASFRHSFRNQLLGRVGNFSRWTHNFVCFSTAVSWK